MVIFFIVWFVCGLLGSILAAKLDNDFPLTWGRLLLALGGCLLLIATLFAYLIETYGEAFVKILNEPIFPNNKEKK